MMLHDAIRLTEILLGLAFFQQSIEHLCIPRERLLFLLRAVLSLCLAAGFHTALASLLLMLLGLCMLQRFQGPYNGGSDRMSLLLLCCLCLVHVLPDLRWKEAAFGYAAIQLLLSYFIAGWVKIINPDWRSGRALQDVFLFSAYPASEQLRGLARKPRLLFAFSWAVMLFELVFPLALISSAWLGPVLVIGLCFHLANAFLFGLNRFFWIWLAAYPSIIWLHYRLLL